MKIRQDYVTNSSSSSFIISCSEVLDKKALLAYLKDEYGKRGLEMAKNYIVKGSEVKKECLDGVYDELYVDEDDIKTLEDDKEYLYVYQDIEGNAGGLASMVYDVSHSSLKHIFSSSWSGFNG